MARLWKVRFLQNTTVNRNFNEDIEDERQMSGDGWSEQEWQEYWFEQDQYYGCRPPSVQNYDFPPNFKHSCNGKHQRVYLDNALSAADCQRLHEIWSGYCDDLDDPKLTAKPYLSEGHLREYHGFVYKVIQCMADQYGMELTMDQATISCTNDYGHKRHADNMVFSVYHYGQKVWAGPDKELQMY